MKIFSAQGKDLPRGAFELDGISYPYNWVDVATPEELKERGISVREIPDVVPVPAQISDRQFFQQLAIEGTITQAEALAAVKLGTLPAALQTIVDGLPLDQRFDANMKLSGATTFHRDVDLTATIGTASGRSPAQMDDFFRAASLL